MSYSSTPPLFYVGSEKGRRSTMEDKHYICENFIEIPLDPTNLTTVIPQQVQRLDYQKSQPIDQISRGSSMARSHSTRGSLGIPNGGSSGGGSLHSSSSLETFHLFSVFDGHYGSNAAEHCASKLPQNVKSQIMKTLKKHALPIKQIIRHNTVPPHVLLAEAVNLEELSGGSDIEDTSQDLAHEVATTPASTNEDLFQEEDEEETLSENVNILSRMSLGLTNRMKFADQERPLKSLISKEIKGELADNGISTEQLVACFNDAFVATDQQFDDQGGNDESGSTAIIALISNSLLCLSHCGDCRGVLFRDGQVIQITREHSPSSEDEQERIQLLGGYVICGKSDTPRVMGVLSMTRAIGDFGLRPYVIPNPETSILKRSEGDRFIVLASDGLWGFLTNQEVCELVNKCFERVESRELSRVHASKLATHVLIKKAIDSGSPDNITVFVIDLRQFP